MKSGDGVTCAQYALPAELLDVIAHLARELGERRRALLLARRSRGALERVERRLRVDHDVLAAREVDDDVRAHLPACVVWHE